MVYHVVSGEKGMIVGITITHGMTTEYRLCLAIGEYRWSSEEELTLEPVVI